MKKKKTFITHEMIVGLLTALIFIIIGARNPAFFSLATLFDIVRSALPVCIMALGVLPVLVSGEIDISFVSVAAMSSFATHFLLLHFGYQGGITLYLIIAAGIGALAGLTLGIVSSYFKLPVFPVSLGFWLFWYGFNLYFISPTMNFKLPKGLVGYYSRYLLTVHDPVVGTTGLHISILYLLVIVIFIWWLLKYTTIGRGLYAMGGNREVAVQTGYNVKRILWIALALNGALASIAGVIQSSYTRFFNPILFRGDELYVIAAAVIGGVSITGGRGSVVGAILGVFFLQVITRGLIYLEVPAEYQQFVVGITLLLFVTVSSIRGSGRRSLFSTWFRKQRKQQ